MSGLMLNIAGGSFGAPPGQQAYSGVDSSYTWVAPSGVTKVSVVVVGTSTNSGGALAYKNNISVTPGNSYNLAVGGTTIGRSYFINTCTVSAANTSARTGDGGGNGGLGGDGAGGAGGYSGNGGAGAVCCLSPTNGAGGGGAGGGLCGGYGSGGGGVGLLGQGASGLIDPFGSGPGGGGSGGASGSGTAGGLYGGGYTIGSQVSGAVRIIWPGCARSFPSTRTANE